MFDAREQANCADCGVVVAATKLKFALVTLNTDALAPVNAQEPNVVVAAAPEPEPSPLGVIWMFPLPLVNWIDVPTLGLKLNVGAALADC